MGAGHQFHISGEPFTWYGVIYGRTLQSINVRKPTNSLETTVELDSILADAIAAYRNAHAPAAPKAPRTRKPQIEPPREPSTLFTAAENWKRTRCVALVHEASATVLGTFAEYLHVRETGMPSATEFTDWMPSALELPAPTESWHTQKTCIVPLTLDALGGAHCALAELQVYLAHGFISAITLACETEFFAAEEHITLPAGANILPVLGRESKAAIFTEIHHDATH